MRKILMLRKFIILISLIFLPYYASADYDSKRLFSKGNWAVEIVHDSSDGDLWCTAETANRQGQSFSISAFDDGGLLLVIFDSDWSLTSRSVSFLIDIDYSRWEITGSARNSGISMLFNDAEKTKNFLDDLSQGSAVALYNIDEFRLATFSLNGSSAALRSLMECWARIGGTGSVVNPTDPFITSKDPF